MFIGFYSLANAVTMFGLISAVASCFLAANGNIKFAIYMLFLSLLCDTFDGRIARSTPNRTPKQKFYGVQLDSLCDAISFGVTPCFIAYSFGFDGGLDIFIYCLFILCGVIRLSYFNTLANANPGKPVKSFRGIPIPMSTPVITFLFLLTTFMPAGVSIWFFRICLFLLAIGFILNIRVKKPTVKGGIIFISIQVALLLILLLAGDCQGPVPAVA